MQHSRVRFSSRAQNLLSLLKGRTKIPINVLARHGLCLSLRDNTIPNADIYDENGTELSLNILFGKYTKMYEAILQQRLMDDKLNFDEYSDRMLRAHLNRGAIMLYPRIKGLDDFAKLVK